MEGRDLLGRNQRRRVCCFGAGVARLSLQERDSGGHFWGDTALTPAADPSLLTLCQPDANVSSHEAAPLQASELAGS